MQWSSAVGSDHHEWQHRRRDDVPVQHDRERPPSGSHGRRGDCCQLGAADLAQHLDRVRDPCDAAHRLLHRRPLAGQAGVVDAGASTDPRRRLTAGQGRRERRRRRRVADPHLAEHQQVCVEAIDLRDGDLHDLLEPLRRQRRLEPDVAGRAADAHVDGIHASRRHDGRRR